MLHVARQKQWMRLEVLMTAKTTSPLPPIDEHNLRQYRLDWVCERVGWSLMILGLIAAAVGLLGPGPLSATTNRTPDRNITVSYNRFEHQFSPSTLAITVAPDTVRDELRLQVNREFLNRVDVQRIIPEPSSSEMSDKNITFTFPLRSNRGAMQIAIRYEPQAQGWLPIIIGAESGMKLQIKQFIFP